VLIRLIKSVPQKLVRLSPLLLVIQLGSLLTYEYYARIEASRLPERARLHHAIVSGEAPYQYRYRILAPYLAEGLARALHAVPRLSRGSPPLPPLPYSRRAFALSFMALNFGALAVLLLCLWRLLEPWFGRAWAMFGMSLAAVLIAFTYRDHFYHPWSFWEAAAYALGMYLIRAGRVVQILALSAVAAATRETTAFLPLGFLLYALPWDPRVWKAGLWRQRAVRWPVASLAVWLAVFLTVHQAIGYQPPTFTLEKAIAGNLAQGGHALLLNGLFLGPMWLFAFWGVFRGPRLVRSFALALAPYFLILLFLGFWWEIRYWMTALPVLVPALLSMLSPPAEMAPPRHTETR
jgi:hypothetical protein